MWGTHLYFVNTVNTGINVVHHHSAHGHLCRDFFKKGCERLPEHGRLFITL